MRNKKLLIITAIIIAIGLIAAIIFFAVKKASPNTSDQPAQAIALRVDPDTGEQTVTDPTLNGKADDTSSITVLGMDNFIQQTNIGHTIIVFTREQIQEYGTRNLADKYATLTIRPEDLVVNGDTASGTIRLGDTSGLVNFTLKGLQSSQYQVTITAPSGTAGGTYTSPVKEFYGE